MDAQAAALGGNLNIFSSGGKIVATPAAFTSFTSPPYLRPFDLLPVIRF
jgi:hypothetical protein